MKKKHILVISQYFYPETFRINDICTEWVKRGYKVTAVTGIPNYPQGKFYDGYGFFRKRTEHWNGISIIRLPLIPRGKNSLGLAANYLSFVASGYIWKLFTRLKADMVFIFEVSPMTQALPGIWYAKKHGVPCAIYVQDLWPENVEIVAGINNPAVIRPIERMVDYIYRSCDHIFATSPSFMREIQKRCRERKKVSYLPQYAEDFYQPVERENAVKLCRVLQLAADRRFKIVFTGNIGKAQGLGILPGAAARLKKSCSGSLLFVIVGDGRCREEFLQQIRRMQAEDMFLMIDRQPAEEIPAILGCCDVAFVSFMDNRLFAGTIPAKLQSYMACRMPVLASASGETERIVREAECGITADIGSEEDLCRAVEKMMSLDRKKLLEMGLNGRRYYEQNFDKGKILDQIDLMLW